MPHKTSSLKMMLDYLDRVPGNDKFQRIMLRTLRRRLKANALSDVDEKWIQLTFKSKSPDETKGEVTSPKKKVTPK